MGRADSRRGLCLAPLRRQLPHGGARGAEGARVGTGTQGGRASVQLGSSSPCPLACSVCPHGSSSRELRCAPCAAPSRRQRDCATGRGTLLSRGCRPPPKSGTLRHKYEASTRGVSRRRGAQAGRTRHSPRPPARSGLEMRGFPPDRGAHVLQPCSRC